MVFQLKAMCSTLEHFSEQVLGPWAEKKVFSGHCNFYPKSIALFGMWLFDYIPDCKTEKFHDRKFLGISGNNIFATGNLSKIATFSYMQKFPVLQ